MIFKIILIIVVIMLVIAIIYDRVTGSKITRWIMWPAILGFIAIVIAIMIKGFID
jgi:hypothetical protein|tara:strand:- start:529 stop:693 length:165 start_codon:yes stop_codon:yes gene_type:complete